MGDLNFEYTLNLNITGFTMEKVKYIDKFIFKYTTTSYSTSKETLKNTDQQFSINITSPNPDYTTLSELVADFDFEDTLVPGSENTNTIIGIFLKNIPNAMKATDAAGGYKTTVIYKKTNKTMKIGNRVHCIYEGTRGGKYVRSNKKWITYKAALTKSRL